jgi:predicted O-methyltransferase YrrM
VIDLPRRSSATLKPRRSSATLKPRRSSATLKQRGMRLLHRAASLAGLIVLPAHYYVPFADIRELERNKRYWKSRSDMVGIVSDVEIQARRLVDMVKPHEPEYRGNCCYLAAVQSDLGLGYGYIEAQALHGVLRSLKPKKIIEIGSGVSTRCMLDACSRNIAEGSNVHITCIDPYPRAWLRSAPVRLIESFAQHVDLGIFSELEDGDFLFIDSTHTVKPGGDVTFIILEVLPRLKRGVTVHFHDIYTPYVYQRDLERSLFQWMETAMLHAFLIENDRFETSFSLSHLHYDRPDVLKDVFPEYVPQGNDEGLLPKGGGEIRGHFPASTYLYAFG